jgi:hypothetical protein
VLDAVGAEFRTRSDANSTEESDLPAGYVTVRCESSQSILEVPTRNYRILRHQSLSIDQRIIWPSTPGKHSDYTEEPRRKFKIAIKYLVKTTMISSRIQAPRDILTTFLSPVASPMDISAWSSIRSRLFKPLPHFKECSNCHHTEKKLPNQLRREVLFPGSQRFDAGCLQLKSQN